MALYCGINLHRDNSVLSLIDETERLVSEKRLDNKLELIEHRPQPYQDEISGVVVESSFNCYCLVDGLMKQGYPVHLANTLADAILDRLIHSTHRIKLKGEFMCKVQSIID